MSSKFYVCKKCGNLVGMIHASGAPLTCCGEEMTELVANSSDGAMEKHVPVFEIKDGLVYVTIGSTLHPMLEEHHIAWVYIKTNKGGHRKELVIGEEPKVTFALTEDEELEEVYEYCNLHGLWVAKA